MESIPELFNIDELSQNVKQQLAYYNSKLQTLKKGPEAGSLKAMDLEHKVNELADIKTGLDLALQGDPGHSTQDYLMEQKQKFHDLVESLQNLAI